MRILFTLIFLFGFSVPALADGSLPYSKDLANVVFKEVEKRAIEKFFGKKAAATEKDDEDKGSKGRGRGKAKGKGKGKGKGRGRGRGRGKGLPPGLAKRDSLPPGLQKQLEKNGTLPPGLAKRALPKGLEDKLPPVADTLERVIAGGSVVLLEKATGKILDVIEGVLKK